MSALHTEIRFVAAPTGPLVSLKVTVCRAWSELELIRAEWNALLLQCAGPSIFLTPEWMSSWWPAFGSNRELAAIIFRDGTNVVGMAPLYCESSRRFGLAVKVLRLVGAGSGDSDALDFIVAPGYEQPCAEGFLSWLASESNVDLCSLETLRADSEIARHIAAQLQQNGHKVYSETSPNFVVDLPATWAEYLAGLESSFRPLLTRYPKRLQSRYRVSIKRCEREPELDANLQALFELHQMRWTGQGEPGAFSSAQRRDFYFRMSRAFLERGWLEFWQLLVEDEIVAAQFCFRYGDTVSLLQEGFHPKYAAEKIGYALRAHVLQEIITSGARHYDFLGGTDSYKAKFGARQNSYLTLSFAPGSLRGRLHLALRHRTQQGKQWLKGILAPFLAARQKSKTAGTEKKTEGRE